MADVLDYESAVNDGGNARRSSSRGPTKFGGPAGLDPEYRSLRAEAMAEISDDFNERTRSGLKNRLKSVLGLEEQFAGSPEEAEAFETEQLIARMQKTERGQYEVDTTIPTAEAVEPPDEPSGDGDDAEADLDDPDLIGDADLVDDGAEFVDGDDSDLGGDDDFEGDDIVDEGGEFEEDEEEGEEGGEVVSESASLDFRDDFD